LYFLEPTEKVEGRIQKAWTLQANEYVRLLDSVSGKIAVHRGEKTVFPEPYEEPLVCDGHDKMQAMDLKVDEYVKILDTTNSEVSVKAGPAQVFLSANERVIKDKEKAIQIDDQHAVTVRNNRTGQLRQVKEKQLFVPKPDESIEEVNKLISLAAHEAMIISDQDGVFHYHYGDPKKATAESSRSFFVPPHSEVVTLNWSSGMRRLKRDLKISRFDLRPNYMWNEIECRTQDNVELVLETTLFWEVLDLAKMVSVTGNLPGDIYNKIRSQFIKQVSQKSLKEFMAELHLISKAVFEEDKDFYTVRGVKVHCLEVSKYTCSEKRTSEVLQQIIEETTNRLNRLSQCESENEIQMFKMQGQLEAEKVNGDLLKIQHEHAMKEAEVTGSAEAARVSSFIDRLAEKVPKLEDRIKMWEVLRKNDALDVVSKGGASLYYTPNDVDLSIKTFSA